MNSRAFGSTSAALLVVVVVLAAILTYTVATPQQVTRTSTSTVTQSSTVTVTVASTSASSFTGSPGPVTFYRTNGDWNFTVILNSTLVTRGQVVAALLNLTNISGQNQTVHVTGPLYTPTIHSLNGTSLWCDCRSGVNLQTNWTYGPGRVQQWDIPTSSLQSGRSYILSVEPFIGANTTYWNKYQIGEDLMINATFTVA